MEHRIEMIHKTFSVEPIVQFTQCYSQQKQNVETRLDCPGPAVSTKSPHTMYASENTATMFLFVKAAGGLS